MRSVILTGLIIILALASCRTIKTTTSVDSTRTVSALVDSIHSFERITLDTLTVDADTAEAFIPRSWLTEVDTVADDSFLPGIPDPVTNTVISQSGRATLSVTRTPSGIRVKATCDSIYSILVSKTLETFRLRHEVDSLTKVSEKKIDNSKVISRIPGWLILTLIISLLVNAFCLFIQFKKILP